MYRQQEQAYVRKRDLVGVITALSDLCLGAGRLRGSVTSSVSAGREYEMVLGHIWSLELLRLHKPVYHHVRQTNWIQIYHL